MRNLRDILLGAAIIAVANIGFFYFSGWLSTPEGPVNQAVFSTFRLIEARCLNEPDQTVRCQGAIEQINACRRGDCSAKEYYCSLSQIGFDLPRFYAAGSEHENRWPCQSRIRQIFGI